MVALNRFLATLAVGVAVVASVSSAQAMGRAGYRHEEARAEYNGGGYPITAARASALRECTAREAQYPEYDWGIQESTIYRSCMAEHGQME
jgi:hypothetical protein